MNTIKSLLNKGSDTAGEGNPGINPSLFNAYCMVAAFGAYFCMYAYRKPFAVGTFDGLVDLPLVGSMDYKIVLIISQVCGYTLSKFLGIKIVSELPGRYRGAGIVGMVLLAEVALILFACVPSPYQIICIFFNGLPLGMIWGLVFGFLEGRRSTELLGAFLSASYIVASGAVKSVGKAVLDFGVSEVWMPAVVGLAFLPFLLFFVYLLQQIPAPSAADEKLRMHRQPMHAQARKRFFRSYAPGLIPLILLYMLLTSYRDFRDNFAREIWDAVGFENQSSIYAASEIPVAFGVLFALALVMWIRNNQLALRTIHLIMLSGSILIGISTYCYQMSWIDPATWMILVGLGLYLGYVPYGCVLFDRLIACVGVAGTAGFMIYLTDAFGYLGSVGLMLYKNFGHPNLSWLNFFVGFSYVTAIFCSLAFVWSLIYFSKPKLTS